MQGWESLGVCVPWFVFVFCVFAFAVFVFVLCLCLLCGSCAMCFSFVASVFSSCFALDVFVFAPAEPVQPCVGVPVGSSEPDPGSASDLLELLLSFRPDLDLDPDPDLDRRC